MIRRARQRPRWEHGCGGSCGRKYGGHCPQRVALRADTTETKSAAGKRAIGLPAQLVELLRAHRDSQDEERSIAAQLWHDHGWVFATRLGGPVNPRTDWSDWKALLRSTGLRDARLHDARHTAATVLLLLGVPERAVMGLMGWSNTAMLGRYQHLTSPILDGVAAQVGGLLWAPRTTPIETATETTSDPTSVAGGRPKAGPPGNVGGGGGI
jgi:integrase